jgi:phenylpropionate dioxygenase-like ring-hydroxylating dioxygenase large terminal subunit
MFPQGHGRIHQPGRPSLRDQLGPDDHQPFDDMLRDWDIDPDSYATYEEKAIQGWKDLKAAKKRLWKEKGYLHYEHMTESETVDSPHNVVFPNVTMSFVPDGLTVFRTEPHPTDPEKCTFDLWVMLFPVSDPNEAVKMGSHDSITEATEPDCRVFDQGRGLPDMEGQIFFQDMALAEGQQRGMHSQGYEDAYLAGQETRVRRFHEVLNDYIEGRR